VCKKNNKAQLDAKEEQIELRQAAQQEDFLAVQLQQALVMNEMEEEAQASLKTARGWVVKAKRRCEILKANREARENNGTATTSATATATTSATATAAEQRTENEAGIVKFSTVLVQY
jgi:hypothetical protein